MSNVNMGSRNAPKEGRRPASIKEYNELAAKAFLPQAMEAIKDCGNGIPMFLSISGLARRYNLCFDIASTLYDLIDAELQKQSNQAGVSKQADEPRLERGGLESPQGNQP